MSIREQVCDALQSHNTRDIIDGLRKIRTRNTSLVLTHVIHQIAAKDDLSLLESVFKFFKNVDPASIVNNPLGRKSYTALSHAAFNGSEKVTKYLITIGADVNARNYHGETLLDMLEVGEAESIEKNPKEAIFIRFRYAQCRRWIQERKTYLERQAHRSVDYTPRLPRRIAAALKILRWWTSVKPVKPVEQPDDGWTSVKTRGERRKRGHVRARAQNGF